MTNQAIVCDAAYRRCLGVGLSVIALTLCALVIGASTASAAPAKCPPGATYNKQTRMCEQPKEQQCPDGSTLSDGKCVKGVTFVCPSGTTLQPDGTCTVDAGRCPEGTTYSEGACKAPFTCPEGYTRDDNHCWSSTGEPQVGTCPEGTDLVPVYDENGQYTHMECVGTAKPATCPSGTTYVSGTDQCSGNPAPTCEAGFTLNVSTGLCEATPTTACPTGTTENTSTGLCESAPVRSGGGGGRPPQ